MENFQIAHWKLMQTSVIENCDSAIKIIVLITLFNNYENGEDWVMQAVGNFFKIPNSQLFDKKFDSANHVKSQPVDSMKMFNFLQWNSKNLNDYSRITESILWVVSDCEQLRLRIVLKIEIYQLSK